MKQLVDGAIGLGVFVIVLSLVALIALSLQNNIQTTTGCNTTLACVAAADNCCYESAAYNSTNFGQVGMNNMASLTTLVGLVIVGAFIIVLVVGGLSGFTKTI